MRVCISIATIAAPALLVTGGKWMGVDWRDSLAAGAAGILCYLIALSDMANASQEASTKPDPITKGGGHA